MFSVGCPILIQRGRPVSIRIPTGSVPQSLFADISYQFTGEKGRTIDLTTARAGSVVWQGADSGDYLLLSSLPRMDGRDYIVQLGTTGDTQVLSLQGVLANGRSFLAV